MVQSGIICKSVEKETKDRPLSPFFVEIPVWLGYTLSCLFGAGTRLPGKKS